MLFCLFGSLYLTSCSGYRVTNNENPLLIYGIRRLAIPVFINQSAISKVSGPITTEIKSLMMSYSGLQIDSEYTSASDAVLLGIIESPQHKSDTVRVTATKFTTGELAKSIGPRNEFYIPSRSQIDLRLRLVLIKKPSVFDMSLAQGEMGNLLGKHPRVVFQETLDLSTGFSREISDNLSPDSGGVVNFTKNKKAQEDSIKTTAKSVANTFKEVVLDAF